MASFEVDVRGKGFGPLVSQLLRAFTYKERQRHMKSIHQDFLLANKLHNKYKDLYGDVPKYWVLYNGVSQASPSDKDTSNYYKLLDNSINIHQNRPWKIPSDDLKIQIWLND